MHSRKRPAKPQPAGVSRREFIAAATAAAFTIVPRRVLGGPGHVPPSERIHIGAIGVGGQGVSDLQEFLKDPNAQVVAVCDVRRTCDYSQFYYGGVKGREPAQRLVNETYATQQGVSNYKACGSYVDFRELLDRLDLDAVSIATPDHLHALPAMAALRKGKHVYCQKPLTYTVRESRALAEAAKQHGVVTQMGNQGHATDRLKRLVEMLKSGTIGQVREVHCWSSASYGGTTRPQETPPVPEGFDWDKWLGPAPYRPYHPAYAPFTWRNWRAFGTGCLGDMGCHIIDPAMWAVGFPKQMTIEASCSPFNDESYAVANLVRYHFNSADSPEPVTLTWYDGGLKPFRPAALEAGSALPASGGMYIGEKGIIVAPHGGEAQLVPQTSVRKVKAPEPFLPRGESHYQEWVRACKRGPAPLSNFSYAGPLTEMVLLGNIALETGKALEWDSDRFEITNVPDANRLLHRQYREG